MRLVFQYHGPVVGGDRFTPNSAPGRLAFIVALGDEEDLETVGLQPGAYVVYESHGREAEEGVPPRFELQESRLRVAVPEPALPKIAKVKRLDKK